uniref:NADH-ubiquinone oxidoreductase chain 1 n=1 Tax=Rediviva intermixta TaxID=1688786 RepID=A0A172CHR1_9HYME|nr:NADH dehydrogenase subunit 1 [Rediviva intermixta]AKS40067.1 NADH dehydrogenase subunit 1 [Rediviva intermixta]
MYLYYNLLSFLFFIVLILISVAFLTLFERKLLGYIQNRYGPNKVGYMGILQPFSDMIKLLTKEFFLIKNINYIYYFFSPVLMMILSLILWYLYPFLYNFNYLNYSFVFLFMILSLSIYSVMMGGWASNSNYAMLGSIRSVAQSISYEVSLFLMMLVLMILIENYSFMFLIKFQCLNKFIMFLFPIYLMFFISMLIELNRTPFDLVEGESELVSGFNVEYFSSMFTLIFMAEYSNIIFMSFLITLFFFGFNCSLFYYMNMMFHIILIIWIRGVLPRVRYDDLMYLCWKKFLSVTLIYLMFIFTLKELMVCFI